jgi:ABC-type sugar transport system ATPase subunit
MTEPAPVVEAKGIVKTFGHVEALRGADLEIGEGEVHALVGDNGAGKSTLVKTLAGVIEPDQGEVLVRGEKVDFGNPGAAQKAGIETVFQDLALADSLPPGANVFLGREPLRKGFGRRFGFVDRNTMKVKTAEHLTELGVSLPSLDAPVGSLSGGQRQAVAVARAAVWGSNLIIMDEPTAALGVRQTEFVLDLITRMRDEKKLSVLLISHNMPDVLRVADRISVLRLGRRVATFKSSETTLQDLTLTLAGMEDPQNG